MFSIAFTTSDLAHTRFAYSPIQEVVYSVRALNDPAAPALYRPWIAHARRRLAESGVDIGLLRDLVPVPSRYLPDFVSPPPVRPVPELADEIAALRATPAAQVRADLDRMAEPRSERVAALHADPAAGLGRLADEIETYWRTALEPYWPKVRALLEGEVLHRARQLADGGVARIFDDLAPAISWRDSTLSVALRSVHGTHRLGGTGLILLPSVFAWPKVFTSFTPPWQPCLMYPARGIATVWETGEPATPAALDGVIGRRRAQILTSLVSAASTTELAGRLGLPASSVSEHLTALRAAGLVSAHRTGRSVLYGRTAVAQSLLDGAAPAN